LIGLGILIFLWKTNFRTKSAEEEVLWSSTLGDISSKGVLTEVKRD
jgi:hypothetical protein